MPKVIILDFGIFMHRAIFASIRNPKAAATSTCLAMILGCLKKVGIEPEDTVIAACDFLKSWRKEFDGSYKGDRAKKREESGIDFKEEYRNFNNLIDHLQQVTSWHFIKIEHLESDDIMAAACRFYTDCELILVTYDTDLEQCWHYPNVKIFSPLKKSYKLKPANFNVYKFISKKVEKERTDNLTSPILNEQDYEVRLKCVSLLELPEWVENSVHERLRTLEDKPEQIEKIPFRIIRERFGNLYSDKSKVISYESCEQKEVRKKEKVKNKARESKKCLTVQM